MPQDLGHFAMMANHAEVELGRLAQRKAQNAQVKQFATQMIADHTKAMRELEKIGGPAAQHHATSAKPGTTGAPARTHTGTHPDTQSRQHGDAHTGPQHPLDAEHQQIYDRLNALSGAEFDREFMRVMVEDHQKAVARFEQETGAAAAGTIDPAGANRPAGTSPSTGANRPVGTETPSAQRPAGTTGTPGDPSLTRWAQQTLPMLRKHLERAQQIQVRLEHRVQ